MIEFFNVVDAMPGDVFLVACGMVAWMASWLVGTIDGES